MIFITAEMVARMIGFDDSDAFLRARERLERNHEFPAPMPTCRRPMKWRADAVTAWVELQGQPAGQVTAVSGPNVILLAEARRA